MKSWINSKWSKMVLVIPLLVIFIFSGVQPVQAAIFDEKGIVAANEIIDDDIFMSNQTISMDGVINGNLLATGDTVVINGVVNGDAFLAGQSIVISDNAKISGNLFIGGQTVDIKGKISGSLIGGATALNLKQIAEVGGNFYFGGFHLLTEPGTKISRDLFFGGYQSILNGGVSRNINVSAAAIELNGTVGKNANIDVANPGETEPAKWEQYMPKGTPPAIKSGLRISKDAKINGKLVYTSSVDQTNGIGVQPQGGIVYQTPVPGKNEPPQPSESTRGSNIIFNAGNTVLDILRNLITLLILGGLIIWWKPVWLNKTQKLALLKPGPAAGYGLVVIILGYLAAGLAAVLILVVGILLSLVTLGGLSNTVFGIGFSSLALGMTVFTLVISYISKLVVACLVGGLIIHKLAPNATRPEIWGLFIGVFLFVIFQPIPVFGFLINLLVTIIGVGATWLLFTNRKMAALVEENPPVAA